MSDRGTCSPPTPPAWLARVRLPETAGTWQLYADMPGAELAAAELTAALREAAGLIDEAVQRVNGRLRKHIDFGAMDTEPRYVARHVLGQMVERALEGCL